MRQQWLVVLCFFLLLLAGCAGHRTRRAGVYHHVHPGQSLYRIAKTYRVDMKTIMRVNRITNPTKIRAGDRVFIPGARRVLDVPVYRPEETAVLEGKLPASGTGATDLQFTWPVKGKIIADFGIEDGFKNNGLAISAKQGTPIRAAEKGKIIYSGSELRDYGNLIIIDHQGGFATVYAHNRVNLVKRGENVKKGQVIAEVGMTGVAETPYVHFEIRRGGKATDPATFLK